MAAIHKKSWNEFW